MKDKMDYEKETRLAYRDPSRARSYKKHHTKGITWARFTMWRERLCVAKALRKCNLTETDKILDIPCGTGILANVLSKFPVSIIASDISREMMNLARSEYAGKNFYGFIQGDITMTPFKSDTFTCVIILGFMHRAPADIREQTLREITSISKRFIIVSYSVDSLLQRLKQSLIKNIKPSYKPAPSPATFRDIIEELNSHNLIIRKIFKVVTFLSAEVVFLLEKKV